MDEVMQDIREMNITLAKNSESDALIWTQRERNVEPLQEVLVTGLESCGLAADDTETVLSGLATGKSLEELARQISTGQILTKRTAHGRRHFLRAIKQRYLKAPSLLLGVKELAELLPALTSQVAKNQVLLPYLLLADRTAFEIMTSLVFPCRQQGEANLPKKRVLAALYMAFRQYGQKPWSESLCVRWVEGLLSVLRDVGALGRGANRERLLPYAVRPEVFSFHLWGLYESGLRGRSLHETPFWRLLLLDEREAQQLTVAVAARGWWKLTTLGAAEEILPTFPSLADWVSHELG
jgi:hypothetical protein